MALFFMEKMLEGGKLIMALKKLCPGCGKLIDYNQAYCDECAEYDGKYYDIDDDSKPDIPLHPNCRCLYINVSPVENWKPTKRKDNSSKEIIDYEDYNDWLKNKGIGVDGE